MKKYFLSAIFLLLFITTKAQKNKGNSLRREITSFSIEYSYLSQNNMNRWLNSEGYRSLNSNYLGGAANKIILGKHRVFLGYGVNFKASLNNKNNIGSFYSSYYLTIGYNLLRRANKNILLSTSMGGAYFEANFHSNPPTSFYSINKNDRLISRSFVSETKLSFLFNKELKNSSMYKFIIQGIDLGFVYYPHFKYWFYGYDKYSFLRTTRFGFIGHRVDAPPFSKPYGINVSLSIAFGKELK
jgi:hypothetical protein